MPCWPWGRCRSRPLRTSATECLRTLTDRYLEALTTQDAARLPLAENVRFTENGQPLKVGEGLWKAATGVGAFREYFADPSTGSALFIGVVDEGGTPAILAARLAVDGASISEIETIVARQGSHLCSRPNGCRMPIRFSAPRSHSLPECRESA